MPTPRHASRFLDVATLAALLVTNTVLSACSNGECSSGQQRCKQDPSGYDYTRATTEGIAFLGDLSCAHCDDGSEVPSPACAAGQTSTCANGSTYGCACGDRQGAPSTPCLGDGGAPETCVSVQRPGTTEIGYVDSFCALSSQPDPQCGDQVESAYCGSDGIEVGCWDGYDVPSPGAPLVCR